MQLLRSLCVLLIFWSSALKAEKLPSSQQVWLGWGLSQSEKFWAGRAPATPKWHLNWELTSPWRIASGSAWESPIRGVAGLNGFYGWENGTQDFGERQSLINGEIGVAFGPSFKGSLFRLGCELLVLSQLGLTWTELRALEHTQTSQHWNGVVGAGPGWQVGWGSWAVRQQTLLGYGINGYHHEVRLAIGAAF